MTHLERLFPPILILASFALVAVFPTLPVVLLALGALAFYALNASTFSLTKTLREEVESLGRSVDLLRATYSDSFASSEARLTALEKATEPLPAMKETLNRIKNRGAL